MRTHKVTRAIAAVLALFGIYGVTVALADPPATPEAAASVAAPAAPAATARAASTPTTAPAADASAAAQPDKVTSTEAERDAAIEKRLTNSGYKPRMRNGTKVWCKREGELGSRLGGQEVCGTPDELKLVVQQQQDSMKDIQKLYNHKAN